MDSNIAPQQPQQTAKPPMSADQLIDLRARVLRGEAVSDDELRHALSSLAMQRGTASASSPKVGAAKDPAYKPTSSLADRFKAFQKKDPSETPKQ